MYMTYELPFYEEYQYFHDINISRDMYLYSFHFILHYFPYNIS